MSGTLKVIGLAVDGTTPIPTGGTLRTKWSPYPNATEYRQDGRQVENADGTKPSNPPWASWGRVTTASFSKGGLPDGVWEVRVTARRNGADIAGSTSDTITVRIGPAAATQPAPTPTPAPAPTYATAADLAALASRVAALESAGLPAKLDALAARVAALEAAGIRPADLPRVGASTAAEELVVVRAGEIVVATRG